MFQRRLLRGGFRDGRAIDVTETLLIMLLGGAIGTGYGPGAVEALGSVGVTIVYFFYDLRFMIYDLARAGGFSEMGRSLLRVQEDAATPGRMDRSDGVGNREYRSPACGIAQPPANFWQPSGLGLAFAVDFAAG